MSSKFSHNTGFLKLENYIKYTLTKINAVSHFYYHILKT